MRNTSPHRVAVSYAVLMLAIALDANSTSRSLCAQGLLKRKPLPDNIQTEEEADRYLTSLEVDELLGYERVKPVCIHFLKRSGVPEFARRQAIQKLADLQQSDPVTVLLPWIERLDAQQLTAAERSTLTDLALLLPQLPPSALTKSRERLVKLATEGNQNPTRSSAMAALAAADRSYDTVWSMANSSSQSLLDVLRSVPHLPSDLPRTVLFKRVEPLLQEQDEPEIQSAAIEAAALLDTRGRKTFETLSDFIQQDLHPEACVRGICNIPSDQWTESHRRPLAESLISRLAKIPIQQRTSREVRESIKLVKTLASLMPSQDEANIRSELEKHTVAVQRIVAVDGATRFDPEVLIVQKGKGLQIVFENEDVDPHKLTAAHSLEAISNGQVVGSTPTVPPGENGSLVFVAPDTNSTYVLTSSDTGQGKIYGAILFVDNVQDYRDQHRNLPTADELFAIPATAEDQ